MKKFRRLVPIIALLGLVIATVPVASASNMSLRHHHHSNRLTYPQFRTYVNNHHIGPNRYTYGGRMDLTLPPEAALTMKCDCYRATGRHHITCPGCGTQKINGPNEAGVERANRMCCDWLNPANWDWSGLFDNILDGLWKTIKACTTGAAQGAMGGIGTNAAMSALGYAADSSVRLTEVGFVTFLVGGCVYKVVGG